MVEYTPMEDDKLHSDLLSPSVRISFPVRGLPPTALHEISEALRAMAMHCEALAYGRDVPEHHRIFDYQIRLGQLRDSLKRIAKLHRIDIREGRPRNSETEERRRNSFGTVADLANHRIPQIGDWGKR